MRLRAPWFLRMPDETVRQVTGFLRQHNIALAVPLGFVSSDTCGQGVEGLGTARQQAVYPREMKKRGIDLDYVVMDEPLFFGHDYSGKNACSFSMDEVVLPLFAHSKLLSGFGRCRPVSDDWEVEASF